MRLDEAGVDLPWLAKDRIPKDGLDAEIVKPVHVQESQFRDQKTGNFRKQYVMGVRIVDEQGREGVWNFACPPGSLRDIAEAWGQEMDGWVTGEIRITIEQIQEGILKGKDVFVARPTKSPEESDNGGNARAKTAAAAKRK